MESGTFYLLLAKLEEEISFQRKVINTFLFARQVSNPEMTLRSIDILKRQIQILRLINLILGEMDAVSERYAREQALLLASESMSLTSLLLPAVEAFSPIFLESVSLYEEPLLDRIEAVAEFIENSLQDAENLATEEIAQTVEDIMRTLEYHVRVGERVLGRIA
jgi:hypothetical protein